MNPRLDNLNLNEIYLISKKSLIREKIKEKEIIKFMKNLNIDEKILKNLIRNNYKKIGMSSLDDFQDHLNKFGTNLERIEKKIIIEIFWNQLIYAKFKDKVKINKEDLNKRIKDKKNKENKKYLLSEILFTISNEENINLKFDEIRKSIFKIGFENAPHLLVYLTVQKLVEKLDGSKKVHLMRKFLANYLNCKRMRYQNQ